MNTLIFKSAKLRRLPNDGVDEKGNAEGAIAGCLEIDETMIEDLSEGVGDCIGGECCVYESVHQVVHDQQRRIELKLHGSDL